MRTRQDRALQIYCNCLDMGCGFIWAADNVLVLSPTPDGAGKPHPALQSVIDRYQDIFCELVPRHGVAPDRLRPAPVAGATNADGDKMGIIRKAVTNAEKNVTRKKAYAKQRRKPPVRKPSRLTVGYYEIIEP